MLYSPRIDRELWEPLKPEILALDRDHTLRQIVEKIRTPTFNPSENQLLGKLNKWRQSKKNLTSRERKKINREIERRNLRAEECEVVIRGEVQPAEKTSWEFARKVNRDYRELSEGPLIDIQIHTSQHNEDESTPHRTIFVAHLDEHFIELMHTFMAPLLKLRTQCQSLRLPSLNHLAEFHLRSSSKLRRVLESQAYDDPDYGGRFGVSKRVMEDVRMSYPECSDSEELGPSTEREAVSVTPKGPKQNGWEKWFDWGMYYEASH